MREYSAKDPCPTDLWLPAWGPCVRRLLAGLTYPKLVCFVCCHLDLFPCEAPEPRSSLPLGTGADDAGSCQSHK